MLYKIIIILLLLVMPAYGVELKISELPAASSAIGTDEIPAAQSGTTNKVTITQIMANESDPIIKAINGWVTCNGSTCSAAGYTPENPANKNIASGYCPLDSNILVPLANLPSVGVANMASADFGNFTCNGSACTIDNASITPAMFPQTGITDEYCLTYESTGATFEWQLCGSMIYPGAGIPLSTGSAWGTSYSTDGSDDCASGAVCLGGHAHSSYAPIANPTFTGVVTFNTEYDNGNCSSTKAVLVANGNKQRVTLTGGCAITFTGVGVPGNLLLRVIQGGTGSYSATWASTSGEVRWPGGVAPVLSTAVGAIDVVTCYFAGNYFYCGSMLDMKAVP